MTHLLLAVLMMSTAAVAEEAAKPAAAPPVPLEEQLKALDAGNQAPAAVSREKLYAVQTRYLPLKNRFELTGGGAANLTADSFLRTNQLQAGLRFHFNDRWALGYNYAWVDNVFKSEVNTIRSTQGVIPDVPYAINRQDLMVEYNVFYGKFRWSPETVSYFDQYISLGYGTVQQNTGKDNAIVADIGFAFWLGRFGSTRFGVKDYYYKEHYRSGPLNTHNIHPHLDVGYIF